MGVPTSLHWRVPIDGNYHRAQRSYSRDPNIQGLGLKVRDYNRDRNLQGLGFRGYNMDPNIQGLGPERTWTQKGFHVWLQPFSVQHAASVRLRV